MTATVALRRLSSIPRIERDAIRPDDVYAWSSTATTGGVYAWCAVIYRSSTGELFRIRCWDGANSGYFPQIPNGALPDGIEIDDDLRVYGEYF